jgi:hypothetical protein
MQVDAQEFAGVPKIRISSESNGPTKVSATAQISISASESETPGDLVARIAHAKKRAAASAAALRAL